MKFKLLDTFLADGFYLTQEYGTNKYFDYTKYGLLGHEGVDFGHSNKTQAIRCVHGGYCLTNYDNAYGRYVIVLDYSLLCATWYCHLSKANIVNGQTVKAGDVIGNMGNTGNSTGAHLHFNFVIINSSGVRQYKEYRYNNGFLDPLYPRDPSTPKKYGINYEIEWAKTLTSMDMYKGYDLENKQSMKSAIDFLVEWWVEGKLPRLQKELETERLAKEQAQKALVTANNAKTTSDIRIKELDEELEGVKQALIAFSSDENAQKELIASLEKNLAECKAMCNQPIDLEEPIITKIADWIKKILAKLK